MKKMLRTFKNTLCILIQGIRYFLTFFWIFTFSFSGLQVKSAWAEQAIWQSVPLRTQRQKAAGFVSGEGFQYVHAITYAPSNPSIAYLSVDTSQVWKSTDGGFSWHSRNKGFIAHGARSIIVDPRNSEIVFAAGFLGQPYKKSQKYKKKLQGIYRTMDGGKHWTFLKTTDFYKQESKGCLFAFDSSSSGPDRTMTIFAGSYDEGLLCSEDGGETWRSVGFRGLHIIDMEENSTKPGDLFIATNEGLYKYFKGERKKIGKGLPDWPRSVAVSPKNPKIVYAAVGKEGVYKSLNSGTTFQAASSGLPFNANFTDIAASPIDSDIVYAKVHKSWHRPFFSYDGARTWHSPESTIFGKLLAYGGFWFSSPFAPHPTEAMTALTVSNGRARILKTLNGGKNWAYSGNGFTGSRMRDIAFSKDGKMVFCLTDHGLWLTEDRGDTFSEFKVRRLLGAKSSLSGDIRGNTVVVSLGNWKRKGLAVSQNLGASWKYFDKFTDRYEFISFHVRKNNIIYAGPYRSLDKGNTWEKLCQTVRAMYGGNGNIIYAVSPKSKRECSILKSIDQGESWLESYPISPFSAQFVQDVAIDPNDPNRIYIGTSFGLWIFDGKKWALRDSKNGLKRDAFGMCNVSCVSVDPNQPNRIYLGRKAPGCGQSNGIFCSVDFGLTWKNITYNLGPELTVWAVEVNPLDSAVYLGTSLGTFRMEAEYISLIN